MKIELLYFAAVRELLRCDQETIEVSAEVRTIENLQVFLGQLHPQLEGKFGSVRFAVNEEFVGNAHELRAGDVVALIPPVAGG